MILQDWGMSGFDDPDDFVSGQGFPIEEGGGDSFDAFPGTGRFPREFRSNLQKRKIGPAHAAGKQQQPTRPELPRSAVYLAVRIPSSRSDSRVHHCSFSTIHMHGVDFYWRSNTRMVGSLRAGMCMVEVNVFTSEEISMCFA